MSDRPSRALPKQRTAAKAPDAEARAKAHVVVAEDTAALKQIPKPADLPAGTLVIVRGSAEKSITRSVMAVFGRTKTLPRATRCSALVRAGFVNVGAAEDETRADLVFGYVP